MTLLLFILLHLLPWYTCPPCAVNSQESYLILGPWMPPCNSIEELSPVVFLSFMAESTQKTAIAFSMI